MRKVLAVSLALFIFLTTAIFSARMVGQAQPIPRSITQLHLLDCTLPCWIGIIPGETTVETAKNKLIAAFSRQTDLRIRDTSGGPDGYIAANVIENAIESDDFFVSVRLTTSTPLDGKNETVQSVDLFESRAEKRLYAPTVADILGTFGAPQGIVIEKSMNLGHEIILHYDGWAIAFYTRANRVNFAEYPRIYLVKQTLQTPSDAYRRWKGLSSLIIER
jgi:hypothetical protein